MSARAHRLAEHRATRDAARAAFDAHYAAIKADIDERGIGGRLADEAIEKAIDVLDEAVTVVEEHPAAVAGTFTALVLWIFRNPILSLVSDVLGRLHGEGSHGNDSKKEFDGERS